MTRPRVLCFWDQSLGGGILGRLPQVAQVDYRDPDAAFLHEHIGEYDAYLATLKVRLDRDIISRASRLRIVGTPSTGLDHLDLPELQDRRIQVISLKTEYEFLDRITATAELTWGLLLACVRRIPFATQAALRGDWARDRYRGHQLSGKTLGILGVGRLGKMVAAYGKAFRMRVLGCDRQSITTPGVEPVDFDTLLRESDVLSIHIHLTPENHHLIGRSEFAKMRPGAVLINTSRGAIINEMDFVEALERGRIGAAGLDVIEGEWRTDLVDHPLIRYAQAHENLVIVPHLGGVTFESQVMTCEFIANKVADALLRLDVSA